MAAPFVHGDITPEQESLIRLDAFQYGVTGLGTAAFDKTQNALHIREPELSQRYLTDLFSSNWLAERICSIVPDEMLRPGYELNVGDVKLGTSIRMRLDELHATVRLKEGFTWERACGGCALMVVADDGSEDPSQPLNEQNIRRILSLNVIERERCVAYSWYEDGPKLGHVQMWLVAPSATGKSGLVLVHESRLVVFEGGIVTSEERVVRAGWGASLLNRVHNIIRDHDMTWNALALMVQNANMGKWKMKNLLSSMRSGGEAAREFFNVRMRLTQLTMGGTRDIKLDADGEDYERLASRFEGIPDSIDKLLLLVSGAAGAPVMVLFGQSPSGLSSTGERDMQWFYDRTDVARCERLKPKLERVIKLVMLEKEGPCSGKEPEEWDLHFPDMTRMTDAQQVDIRNKQAQTDAIELQWGIVTPAEVRKSRHRPEGWSWRTEIEDDAEMPGEALSEEDKALLDQGQNPGDHPGDAPGQPQGGEQPAGGDTQPPANPNAVDPKQSLAAGQISAMLEVITAVAEKKIPRETGIAILVASFPIDAAQAEGIMGEVGKSFTKEPAQPPVPFGSKPPMPAAPGAPATDPEGPSEDEGEDPKTDRGAV